MLAISDDRFANPNAPLQCKSYKDVAAKIQSLADMSVGPVHIKQGLIWLADQIRMRYRLEPIGICGALQAPRLVLGTGYVPQALIWYGTRRTTKGDERSQFNLLTLNINNGKGDEHTMRSSDEKILARRLKADMFDLFGIENDLYDLGDCYNNIIEEISVGGTKNYVPHMEEAVRREVFNYFYNEDKVITPGLAAWIKEKTGLVEANNKFLKRESFIRDAFLKRSVILFKLPMLGEYQYFLQEAAYSDTNKAFEAIGKRVFFSEINDASYPHIVAVNNMLRMKDKELDIFSLGYGFQKDFNFFSFSSISNLFDERYSFVMFPSHRIPSEGEMLGAQEAKINIGLDLKTVSETESVLSILNF
jgi:hypothetical protein